MLVFAVALPLLGLVLYTTYSQGESEAAQARTSALSLAQITAANVAQFLSNAETLLAQVAQRPLVQAMNPEHCDPFLQEIPNLFPEYIGLGVIDASGQVICSAAAPAEASAPSLNNRPWFQTISRTNAFTVSEAQVGRITGRWVSVLAYPIAGEDGEFAGAVILPIDLVRFQVGLNDVTRLTGMTITILDARGTVVARSIGSENWLGQNMRGTEIVDETLAETEGQTRALGVDGTERLYGFTTIPGAGWHVYAGIPAAEAFAPVRAVVINQGLLALVVILLVSVLVGYLRRQIEQPMRSLLDVAEAVAAGRLDQRAPVDGPKEFAEVAAQFNHMLDVREEHTARLEHHARQLETLGQLGQAATSSLDLAVLLDRVLAHVAPLLSAEGGAIWVLEQTELHCIATSGLVADGLKDRRLSVVASGDPAPADLVGDVFYRNRSIYVEDTLAQDDPNDPFRQVAKESNPPIRSIQAVPIKLHGSTYGRPERSAIGMIQAVHQQPHALTPDDLQLLEAAASWTAIAIGNAWQHEQLRHLAQQVITVQEAERKRLAQELHDEAGQALTALKYSLKMLHDDLLVESNGDSPVEDQIQRIRAAMDLTDNTMQQLRMLSHGLHPPSLSHFGLNLALQEFSQDFAVHTGLSIDYAGDELPPLPDAISICFYRFLQEALTNVAKHAEANEVQVRLFHDDETIALEVNDDGKGFDPDTELASSQRAGIGLLGMQERFKLLDGECQIESAPGQGTRLLARCRVGSQQPDPIMSF